jgi:hypothetical protein
MASPVLEPPLQRGHPDGTGTDVAFGVVAERHETDRGFLDLAVIVERDAVFAQLGNGRLDVVDAEQDAVARPVFRAFDEAEGFAIGQRPLAGDVPIIRV